MVDKLEKWKLPPIIKIYEALGAVADKRIKIEGNQATVKSSSGNKEYKVFYDPNQPAITANDNGSYWQGYLGYPAIAFLLAKNILLIDSEVIQLFKGFAWKDLNTKFKNDFNKTEAYVLKHLETQGMDSKIVGREVEMTMNQLENFQLSKLVSKDKPPQGY